MRDAPTRGKHPRASAHQTETGLVLGNDAFGPNPGFALGSVRQNLALVAALGVANGSVAIARAGVWVCSPKICIAGDGSAAGAGAGRVSSSQDSQLLAFSLHRA